MTIGGMDAEARMYARVQDVSARLDVSQYPRYSIDKAIQAATARCESYCNRVFMRVPAGEESQTRHFLGQGMGMLPVDDLLEMDTVTVDGATVETDELRMMPFGKTPTTWLEYEAGGYWEAGVDVAIAGAWGYSALVPYDIWDSVVTLVCRAVQQAKAGYQDASASPELGELVYSLALPNGVRECWNNKKRHVL